MRKELSFGQKVWFFLVTSIILVIISVIIFMMYVLLGKGVKLNALSGAIFMIILLVLTLIFFLMRTLFPKFKEKYDTYSIRTYDLLEGFI